MSDFYDLHVHSTMSDGSYTPFAIIDAIQKLGFRGVSITDHDTIEAYSDEVIAYAKKRGVDLIPGVEFSTYFRDVSVHILGYGFDVRHPVIKQFCLAHTERRRKRNQAILDLLEREGMKIGYEELLVFAEGSLGRPHIAHVMKLKGYVESEQEAFDKWIGDKRCCFAKGEPFTLEETVSVIHKSKGKAVLAHPILLRKRSLIRAIGAQMDGMECYYARFPEDACRPILKLAKDLDLIPTGGSDFHGSARRFDVLGSSYVGADIVDKLYFPR